MAITVHLSEILKDSHMTAKELCAKVGITEANLSILRSGKANGVRFHTINKICYYLACDVGDILRFDGRLEDEDDDAKETPCPPVPDPRCGDHPCFAAGAPPVGQSGPAGGPKSRPGPMGGLLHGPPAHR